MNKKINMDSLLSIIHSEPLLRSAFEKVCMEKMVLDGYIDMSYYIQAQGKKEDFTNRLQALNSSLIVLFNNPYPKDYDSIKKALKNLKLNDTNSLSLLEAKTFVLWIYKLLNPKERTELTKAIFKRGKMLGNISVSIDNYDYVFYNKKTVELEIVSSIEDYIKVLNKYKQAEKALYYRGHSDANYMLKPSIMRNSNWKHHEKNMYNELLIECPNSFQSCKTHFERLVIMQHYGLPTRMLDITRNPMVALYFACCSNHKLYGEIVLISVDNSNIKYPQSDTATVLSCFPLFTEEEQRIIAEESEKAIDDESFNNRVPRLLHEIRLEKPAFLPEIKRSDITDSFLVLAFKDNNRIIKQDGAFILCGLLKDCDYLDEFRLKKESKKVVVLVENKTQILNELDSISINEAALFPEIDKISQHIKNKYKG